MTRLRALIPVLLLAAASLCLPTRAVATLAAGDHTLQIEHGGERRALIVHVPPGLPAGQPVPLVLAFHGGGGHAAYMADDARYGLGRTADREGFVVVYPNGHSRLPGGRFATWNAGGCCGDARDRQVDDVGFVRAVLAELGRLLTLDPQRLYATGMSNGGMLAHRLACEMADTWAAVASVAGTEAVSACQPSRPISVLHIHALDDDHVLYRGGAGDGAFRDRAQVMEFVSVPDTIAHWVARNRCQPTPQTVRQVPGARCEAYRGCAGGVEVQLCSTDTGGHSWPGAERTRLGKARASQALSANAVIWDFFKAHPKR